MNDPWALFNAGLWFVFLTWAIALHLCGDQSGDPGDPGRTRSW